MKNIAECSQKDCDSPANFRFTWPGRDEAGICLPCAIKMQAVIGAMGLYVQMIPLTPEDYLRAVPVPPPFPEVKP